MADVVASEQPFDPTRYAIVRGDGWLLRATIAAHGQSPHRLPCEVVIPPGLADAIRAGAVEHGEVVAGDPRE